MNTSSRATPERRMPSPTSRSLPYAAAVSISRYPVAMATSTAPTVSAGGVWKTPSPMAGICRRLLRVICGLLALMVGSPFAVRPSCLYESDAAQPPVDHLAAALGLLAANGESLTQLRAPAGRAVLVDHASKPAHRVGREGVDRLAGEVVSLCEREHDPRRADVPDGAADQDRPIAAEGRRRVGNLRTGIVILFADVALNGGVIIVRVGIDGLDLEHVAAEGVADHAGDHFRVADGQVLSSSVEVVFPGAREEYQEHPATGYRPGRARGVAARPTRPSGGRRAQRETRRNTLDEGPAPHGLRARSSFRGPRDSARP